MVRNHGDPRPLDRRAFDLIFSFEFLLVLFLFAGRLKANPRFDWVPIDITAVLFTFSVLIAGLILYRSSFKLPRRGLIVVLFACAFGGWVLMSLGWTPSVGYAREKSLSLVALALWPLAACALILAPNPLRVKKFIDSILLIGLLMSIDLILLAVKVGPSRVMIEVGSEYLGVGRVVGLAAPIFLLRASVESSLVKKLIRLGCFFATAAAVILSGGRGPAVAMLAAMLVPVAARVLRRGAVAQLRSYVKLFIVVVLLGTASVAMMTAAGLQPATAKRTEMSLTTDSGGHSTAERFRYYSDALEAWREDPVLGRGVGSFPVLFERADEAFYPHNIFLEVLVENGVIGVVLLLVLGGVALRLMRRKHSDIDMIRLIIVMMFVNTFVNAQVTADLPDNRLLFAVLGLMALKPQAYDHQS